jgi:hypothetical protein
VLHDEQGVAEARGEMKRKDVSKLLHEGDRVYILMVLMYGEDIPFSREDHLLILVSHP